MKKIIFILIIALASINTPIQLLAQQNTNYYNSIFYELATSSKYMNNLKYAMSHYYKLNKGTAIHYAYHKEPYLIFTGENTKMVVLFQTYSTLSCTIKWGLNTTYSHQTLSNEYNISHQHKVEINGLKPNTKYYYCVNANDDKFTGTFYTAKSENDKELVFYAYGDTRTYPENHNKVAEQIIKDYKANANCQTFVVNSGDLVANGDIEIDWDEQLFDSKYQKIRELFSNLPFMAAVGNHEGAGKLFAKYFPYDMYLNNRYYYSFDNGPVHFTMIDQFSDYKKGSKQYNWIENDLSKSNKKWKIILLHKMGWSAGGHHNSKKVQKYIQPLAKKYGVQFIIGGHNHYYARAIVNGIQHITTGGGGAPMYNPDTAYPNIVKADKSNHFCKISIKDKSAIFKAVRSDGTLIETFNLTIK